MATVIPFPVRSPPPAEDDIEIDLMTAVDAAIRDLRDIARALHAADSREQAEACRRMLEKAYAAARA